MAPKSLVLLGLFALLFVISEVAAASERQSGTVKSESEKTVQPDQNGGRHSGDGGYNVEGYGGGVGNENGGGYRGRGDCRHGCCVRGNYGCSRCCSYAGEAVQTQPGH